MSYEAFISYRRRGGKELAYYLHKKLTECCLPIFLDNEELHFGDFRKQLIKNNLNSRVLILLLSPGALDRCNNHGDWIKREISLFLGLHKKVIVVKYKGFEYPDDLSGILKRLPKAEYIEYDGTFHGGNLVAEKIVSILQKKWDKDDYQKIADFRNQYHNDDYNLTLSYKTHIKLETKDKAAKYTLIVAIMSIIFFLGLTLNFYLACCFLFLFNFYVLLLQRNLTKQYEFDKSIPSTLFTAVKTLFMTILIVGGSLLIISILAMLTKNIEFLHSTIFSETVSKVVLAFFFVFSAIALSLHNIFNFLLYTPMLLNATFSRYLCAMHNRHHNLQKIHAHPAPKIVCGIIALITTIFSLITIPFE